MSTHNIGFYEDLTKIIFELSSNIIKYAPYFFCCEDLSFLHFDSLRSGPGSGESSLGAKLQMPLCWISTNQLNSFGCIEFSCGLC